MKISTAGEVQAAGGVVARPADRSVEVVLVHRPKYDDWSFPKGKLDAGEEFEDAALREVHEETALSCRLVRELSAVSYRDAQGRPKRVRYWLMSPLGGDVGERRPDAEVDDVRWVAAERAGQRLTYEHDRLLLEEALRILAAGNA